MTTEQAEMIIERLLHIDQVLTAGVIVGFFLYFLRRVR